MTSTSESSIRRLIENAMRLDKEGAYPAALTEMRVALRHWRTMYPGCSASYDGAMWVFTSWAPDDSPVLYATPVLQAAARWLLENGFHDY